MSPTARAVGVEAHHAGAHAVDQAARRVVDGGEEVGLADRHAQHRHLQPREPDAHRGRDALFGQDALEQQRDDLDRRALDRRGRGLLQRLLALVQFLEQRRRADRAGDRAARRRRRDRRRAMPCCASAIAALQARATPARPACARRRRTRAAGGRSAGSGGRAPPRRGRRRAPAGRRGSSGASRRRRRPRPDRCVRRPAARTPLRAAAARAGPGRVRASAG